MQSILCLRLAENMFFSHGPGSVSASLAKREAAPSSSLLAYCAGERRMLTAQEHVEQTRTWKARHLVLEDG